MSWLPEGLSEAVFGALLGVSFTASLITATLGLGGGILLLAILASLMPPAALIPVHGVVQLGSNFFRAAFLLRHVCWRTVPAFVAGSVLGAGAGGLVAVDLPPGALKVAVGLFVLWTVFFKPPRQIADWPLLVGGFSSLLTMFVGATGPFVATHGRSLGLDRHGFVATHATFMSFQHGLKVVVFGLLGFAFGEWWAVILGMIAAGVLGTLAGKHLLGKMSEGGFKRALDMLLALIALRLVWTGLF